MGKTSSSWARIVALAVALGAPEGARADAPALVPIQGFLTDALGTPIEGATEMTFSLYTSETSTVPLYRETQAIDVQAGYFTAYIGDVTPLGLAIFRDNGTLYVGVRIGMEPEMMPRALLGSVPFAGFAQYAGEVPFARVTGVPADLADGDADTRYSAGSGLMLMGTTFSVDAAVVQSRVSGTCPAGQAIRAIGADGTVTCETTPAYSAGTGLTLTGTTFSVDLARVQARVSGTCPAGQAIRAIGADGTVTCEGTSATAGAGIAVSGSTISVVPWTLRVQEVLAPGRVSGWGTDVGTNCGIVGMLGGYGIMSGGCFSKSFSLPAHGQVRIVLDYHFVDSWDGEEAYVIVDGTRRWSLANVAGSGTNICGGSWDDRLNQTADFEFAHSGGTIAVSVCSSLDQGPTDESFGFSNFRIYTRWTCL